jgi:hypothetical protein
MNNFYPANGLANGQPEDLNAIDGANLQDKDGALVIEKDSAKLYTLDASSNAAQDLPRVVTPLTNAGTKRWILVKSFNPIDGALQHLVYVNLPGGF